MRHRLLADPKEYVLRILDEEQTVSFQSLAGQIEGRWQDQTALAECSSLTAQNQYEGVATDKLCGLLHLLACCGANRSEGGHKGSTTALVAWSIVHVHKLVDREEFERSLGRRPVKYEESASAASYNTSLSLTCLSRLQTRRGRRLRLAGHDSCALAPEPADVMLPL